MMVSIPVVREGVRLGTVSVFSWKTKEDSKATISSGV